MKSATSQTHDVGGVPETAGSAGFAMRKRFRAASLWLIVILVFAFALRVGFARNYARHASRQALSVIPFLFEPGNIAYSLAAGNGFSSPQRVDTGPTAWMTPVYPALLAGIFRLFGAYSFPSFVAGVALNILCATLTCIPVFLAGTRLGGTAVAVAGAGLWAVFPNAILIPVESLWDASLSALLAATIFWATLALADSERWRDWCAYGLLWGLALMTNPTLGSLLPFLLGWLIYRGRRGKRGIKRAALATVLAILCCVPWTIRNYAVFHRLVPLRSVFGLSLWLGNNERTLDRRPGALHPISDSTERAKYIQLGEMEYMRQKRQEAVRYILSNPRREAHLMFRRFVATWSGGSPYPVEDFLRSPSLQFRGILLFNLLAAAGALLGIVVLARRRSPYAFPAAVFPLVFPLVYYLTLSVPRYRFPVDPVVLALAAVAVAGWRKVESRPVADLSVLDSAGMASRRADAASFQAEPAVSEAYARQDQERMSQAKNYFAWLGRLVTPELGQRVVEVGCGIGNFTPLLFEREMVIAVDRDPDCIARLKQRYPRQKNLRTLSGDASGPVWREVAALHPDSCVCLNVLEHIEDDRQALRAMASVLAPSGVIVLLLPAFKALYGPIDRNLGHYRRYTRASVRRLAEASGLRLKNVRYVNLIGFFGWWMNARLLRRQAQSAGQIQFFDRYLVPLISRLEGVVLPPLGQSLLVVAQKP